MLKGISKVETEPFYSSSDDAEDDASKTKFLIGALDVDIRAQIGDNFQSYQTTADGAVVRNAIASRNLTCVRFGLRGVENFTDEKGQPIKYETESRMVAGKMFQVCTDSFMQQIPGNVLAELGEQIWNRNTLTEDLRKKLLGQL